MCLTVCLCDRFYIGSHSPGVPDGGPDNVPEVHQRVSSHAECIQQQGNN